MKCEDCCHAEMCKWIDELVGRGCDFGEPCDDAISRADALKVASHECQEFRGIYGRIEDGIQKLPSVTHKSGQWIIDRKVIDKSRKPTTYYLDTHCSKCGFKYAFTTDEEDSIPANYCPNCGARMVESQESEG